VLECRPRETLPVAFTRADTGEDVTRSGEPELLDVGLRMRTGTDDRIQCSGHQPKNVRIVEVA
jgi:hypothetical protein